MEMVKRTVFVSLSKRGFEFLLRWSIYIPASRMITLTSRSRIMGKFKLRYAFYLQILRELGSRYLENWAKEG
jgi:hypothetical protein